MLERSNHGSTSQPTVRGGTKVAIKEAERLALMHIIKENLNEAHCILIQHQVQAHAVKKEGGTGKYAARVVKEEEDDGAARR